jgi:hypothetical protein
MAITSDGRQIAKLQKTAIPKLGDRTL